MKIKRIHEWRLTAQEARELQEKLTQLVVQKALPRRVLRVAAADVAIDKGGVRAIAAVLVFSFPELSEIERVIARGRVSFPYVPGLLTFREGPLLVEALRKLRIRPDVILFDGQGIAHFRGIGIATHMGLLVDMPTVGCAKKPLIRPVSEPQPRKGGWSPIRREGRTVGAAVRTRSSVRPVYVSPGHLADVPSSVRLVLDCCRRFRIPEPLRSAHWACNSALRQRAEASRKHLR